ncbi:MULTISPECIES: Crp/Fnr family transcriptional regulator [Sphingobacterium]|uniref:Crp/Fnr family transcriptional regulator n=1 Tax=Sphingobacterium TaxID=28453 RepID=UPI0013DA0093|nr:MULTISPECIES: Crp/Fnr family transcriptional regulator [unclassified Sphingobacterium]
MIPLEILLEKGAVYRQVSPGEAIFQVGSHASFYYQLVSGRIRWCNVLDDGKEVLHELVEPGDAFGELPLFDNRVYAATAVAETPSVVLRLCVSSFNIILQEYSDLHFAFTSSIVQKLRFKFLLTELLASNDPVYIVSQLITYFNDNGKFICEDCRRLMLTRQQLANMIGCRVETVIRAIRQMQKDEQLDIVKGKVFIPSDGIFPH